VAGGLVAGDADPWRLRAHGAGRAVRPADAATVLLTWTGGACDTRVRLKATRADGTVHLGLRTDESGMECNAAGIGRAVTIWFVAGVDASSVVLDPAS